MMLFWVLLILVSVAALPAAIFIAALIMSRRLDIGMDCAKCGYHVAGLRILRCPECGCDFREVGLISKQQALRRTTIVMATCWTLVVVVAFGAAWLPLREIVPLRTVMSPHIRLTHSLSGAYSKADINLETQSQSGWFGSPDKITQLEWTATFFQQTAPPTFQPPVNPNFTQAEIDAAFRGEFATIATLSGDQLAGGMMLQRGEDVDRFDGPIDVDTLTEVMQCLFPNANASLIALDADELLTYLTAPLDGDVVLSATGLRMMRPTASASGRRRAGGYAVDPLRSMPTGPAIALVLGVFAAVWLYGLSVILRWGRRRLRP